MLASGCISSYQTIPRPPNVLAAHPDTARIVLRRPWALANGGVGMTTRDGQTKVGIIAAGGELAWDRPPGEMSLSCNYLGLDPEAPPLVLRVDAGATYHLEVDVGTRILPVSTESGGGVARESIAVERTRVPVASVPQQSASPFREAPPIHLPPLSWPPENIAVADLAAYTLSPGEVKTLSDKLHTALVQTKYFNVLSRSDMKAVFDSQKFQRTDACDDSACLVEMGKILAVQKIVGGSIGKVGSTYSVALRLVNVETGKTEITADRQLKAEPDQLLDLIQEAGKELALKYAESKKAQ